MTPQASRETVVLLVDDERAVTDGLAWLLESVRIPSRAFHTPSALLRALPGIEGPACAVVDMRMPEMTGLELQERVRDLGVELPIVFLTAHGDVPAAVRAMQGGAVDFMQKPFNPDAFLASVNRMIRLAQTGHDLRQRRARLEELRARLTPREREVLAGLLRAQSSKEIARRIGINPKTVDVHRANLMKKLGVTGTGELVALFSDDPEPPAPAFRPSRTP